MTTSYAEVPQEEAQKILEKINNENGLVVLDNDKTKILRQNLQFALGWKRIICEDYSTVPYKKTDFLTYNNKIYTLHYSPNPYLDNHIHEMNINLNEDNIVAYISFFYDYFLKGSDRLKPILYIDDIHWQDDLPPMAKKSLVKDIKSYPIIKIYEKNFEVVMPCVFRSSLIEVSFLIGLDGQIDIQNKLILIDDLPVHTLP
jgi:hypothetical protein